MAIPNFKHAHEEYIKSHLRRRSGERKGRLSRGHGHGEVLFLQNVWWPLFNNFDNLHPEYEVPDWRGRPYFADFAYLPGRARLLIEIKGYVAHVQDMDRQKYCNELNRELYLQTLGFRVLSFAYDDVDRRPELCRYFLESLLNRYQSNPQPTEPHLLAEMEIVRYALAKTHPIQLKEVYRHFNISYRTAKRMMSTLCDQGWFRPIYAGYGQRVHRYELIKGRWDSID